MAPDISAISSPGQEVPDGTSGYEIDKDAMIDSYQRKIRVLTIGGGVSGIMMAYKIQKECKNVDHVIYEKNADIGGTWLENRYPNCACDIPSHAYIYNFAPNVGFSTFLVFFSMSSKLASCLTN